MRSLIIPECKSSQLYLLVLPVATQQNLMVSQSVGYGDTIGLETALDLADDRVLTVDLLAVEYACEGLLLLV